MEGPRFGEPFRSSAHSLRAADLEAVFLPGRGMIGVSLRHRGAEILRRVDDLEAAAARGSTAGLPLLHPWANRLTGLRYSAAGREVELDPTSPVLHLDDRGLPMHGVPWSQIAWQVIESRPDRITTRLDWQQRDLLGVFPYPHHLELRATLQPDRLNIETTLFAGSEGPVPASFGFHPYLGLPGLPRAAWRLKLPAMRRLVLDPRGIPTGDEEPFAAFDDVLGERAFDDGFAVLEEPAPLSITGGGRRIRVELLTGFPYAQIFAPNGKDFIALEPMTAPTNALASGRGLRLVEAGGELQAAFEIRVEGE
jgi:aldose 1-epimerase